MFFFFNDTATTEIYTLSLHDALPIWRRRLGIRAGDAGIPPHILPQHAVFLRLVPVQPAEHQWGQEDRKSTRLNSSHTVISYAVFCLKKKKKPLRLRPIRILLDLL